MVASFFSHRDTTNLSKSKKLPEGSVFTNVKVCSSTGDSGAAQYYEGGGSECGLSDGEKWTAVLEPYQQVLHPQKWRRPIKCNWFFNKYFTNMQPLKLNLYQQVAPLMSLSQARRNARNVT